MNTQHSLLVTLFFLVGAASILIAQSKPTDSPLTLSSQEGLQLLRQVNNAEAGLYRVGRYGRLVDITGLPDVIINGPSSGTVKNYTLTVVTDAEGQHYNATLLPTVNKCDLAYFSNDTGVIYAGKALGCQ